MKDNQQNQPQIDPFDADDALDFNRAAKSGTKLTETDKLTIYGDVNWRKQSQAKVAAKYKVTDARISEVCGMNDYEGHLDEQPAQKFLTDAARLFMGKEPKAEQIARLTAAHHVIEDRRIAKRNR